VTTELDAFISQPLREAERKIGLALSRLSDIGPGGRNAWAGSWGHYKKIAQLMVKTRRLADEIERREMRP
jgi:hypothetical protein